MVDPADRDGAGAGPTQIHLEKKAGSGLGWLPWLLLALGLLALLFALSRCDREEVAVAPAAVAPAAAPATPPVAVEQVTLPGGRTVALTPATLNYDLQRYLASPAPTPRTFTFDQLNFETGSSAIREADRPTVDALSQILAAYPNARVRLVGYADARGTEPANSALGADRARAVASALTGGGIVADRVETASGGEADPVATNATADGRLENRRTELIVTGK